MSCSMRITREMSGHVEEADDERGELVNDPYTTTQAKLAVALRAVEVMSKAKPSAKLSPEQIQATLTKARALVVVYDTRLNELEKHDPLHRSKKFK
jgi:hypothetical protein